MKKNKIKSIMFWVVSSILLIILLVSIYINKTFSNVTFDQLIYSLKSSVGTSPEAISGGFKFVFWYYILILVITISIIKFFRRNANKYFINMCYKNKKYNIQCYPIKKIYKIIMYILFVIVSIFLSLKNFKVFEYIKFQISSSKIFEEYYVDSSKAKIESPENKKNLIYIYVESLESTNVSKENGGAQEISYIPELESIANDNINFSNTDKIGGALNVYGTGWTAAALVSYTSGTPLKVPIDGNGYDNYGSFLDGVYSLGEVLESNGYKNYFMLGSDAKFGGRKIYFKSHGNYEIMDYKWAKKEKLIKKNYKEWWGFEDKKLYEYAKDKLTSISKNDEPFNFTMLTADTHFVDGYLDKSCDEPFDSQYANVFHCTDRMLGEFINWIKKQDFYDNTVIIIVGDHLTMQNSFYENIDYEYTRTVYNAIINSDIETKNTKNRLFSTMDMYPTTLASLGFKIKGDRLGLGTNLFSKKQTLIEELGYDYFDDELKKNSKFYNKYLLGNDYYEMKKTLINSGDINEQVSK